MEKWTVADIPSQAGNLAVVTGANSGIGWQTALELARAGSEVILAARTEAKGREAVELIRRHFPQAKVRAEVLDLASLQSVRAFAAKVGGEAKLDLLVNNAGVMSVPQRETTADGFELQFGTNFLGPFALTGLLMPALQRAASPRVTTVASAAAKLGMRRIKFDDLQVIGLLSNAAHPGYARTNLQTSGPGRPQNSIEKIIASFLSQDAAHGALSTLRAATAMDAAAGSFYGPDRLFQLKGDPVLVPVPKPARDEAASRTLWEVSEKLTRVHWLP